MTNGLMTSLAFIANKCVKFYAYSVEPKLVEIATICTGAIALQPRQALHFLFSFAHCSIKLSVQLN